MVVIAKAAIEKYFINAYRALKKKRAVYGFISIIAITVLKYIT